jgi:hypothetical protein
MARNATAMPSAAIIVAGLEIGLFELFAAGVPQAPGRLSGSAH